MKIVYITPFPPSKDGIADYSYKLLAAIKRQSKKIDIVSIYSFKKNRSGDKSQQALMSYNIFDWIKINRQIKKNRPDLVHLQFDISNYMLLVLPLYLLVWNIKRTLPTKLAVTYHEAYRDRELYGRLATLFYRIFSRPFDRIYVHTELSKQRLVDDFKITPAKIVHIPHGSFEFSSKKQNHSTLRRRYRIDDNKVVLSFGYIYKSKGLEHLVDAITLLKDEGENIPIVLIAGEVPRRHGIFKIFQFRNELYLASLKKRIRYAGIDDYVRFIGYIDRNEVYSLFTLAQIVVLPYISVDQSGVLSIAIASHTPVIASDIGGIGEILRDAGVLVPPADSQALAKSLAEVFNSRSLRIIVSGAYAELCKKMSAQATIRSISVDYFKIIRLRSISSEKKLEKNV